MAEKNGFGDEQEEFWHPDGSGRKVNRATYADAIATLRARNAGLGVPAGEAAALATPEAAINRERGIVGLGGGAFRARLPERWLTLPLVGFGERPNSLTGHPEPVPFFYEGSIETAQIVGVCQIPDQFIGQHAHSDIYLRFGGKVFCTLTPQQVLRRLGVTVEEVAS